MKLAALIQKNPTRANGALGVIRTTILRAGSGLLLLLSMTVALLDGCGSNVVMSSGSGVFVVTPSTAAFGSVAVGQSASLKVSLINKTLSAVEISAANITGSSFAIISQTSFPVTVASGATYTFIVQFSPSAVGAATGQITVATNAASASATVVGLSGTGTTTASSTDAVSSLICTDSAITGSGTTTCTVGLSFAASSSVSVNLASDNAALTVPANVTVAYGATTASFAATMAAVPSTQTATLTATANGGAAKTSLTLNAIQAQLSVNASSVPFGDVLLGDTASQSVTLSSTGTTAVTVNSASLSGTGFLISSSSFPATLTPGQTATVTVEFSPTVAGNATGSLAIVSTSQTNPTSSVTLTGTGVSTAVALTWDAPTSTTDAITSYRMYRAPSGSSIYTMLASIPASTTAYTDASIASATTYAYYVTAVDSSGAESVPSNTATVAVP